jgi:hypothetical protein
MINRTISPTYFRVESLFIIGVYIFLTVLVSGLFALDRGIFHDDIITLTYATAHQGHPLQQLFGTRIATRKLIASYQTIATWLGKPAIFMNLLYVTAWFFMGVCSYFLVKTLFPSRKEIAFVAGALSLTATGDSATNALAPLYLSVLFYFAALVFLLKWWKHEGKKWLFPSALCLLLSVWTYDASLAAILMTPILLWVIDEFRLTTRLLRAIIFWYGLITPYLTVFFSLLFDRNSHYFAIASVPMTLNQKVIRIMMLFTNNFTPWAWGFGWRHWFPAPPRLLPVSFRLALCTIGISAFALVGFWLLRQKETRVDHSPKEKSRYVFIGIVCLLMAFASNAIYATSPGSGSYYRTQLVSGIWVSMAIALLAYGLAAFVFKHPSISLILPTFFVGFGIYGGLESQDYLLGYWRQHKAELRSILEQVPAVKPDTRLILYVPPPAPFLATEAEYLARCWMTFLYNDPSIYGRVFLWSKRRNTECINDPMGFICRGEDQRESVIPYDRSVLLVYSLLQNRYILQKTLPDHLLVNGDIPPVGYNPNTHITPKEHPPHVLSVLYSSQYLASWLKHEDRLISEGSEILSQYSPSKIRRGLHAGSIDIFDADRGLLQLKIVSPIHTAGWAHDPYTKKPADFVLIVDRDSPFIVVPVKYIRQDIADALRNKNLAKTGWDIIFSASELGKGKHRLEFFVPLSEGGFAPLTNHKGETFFDIEIQ